MDDKIVAYVNGKLSAEELAVFEELLGKDEELAKEVTFYKDIAEVSEVRGEENLDSMIKGIEAELDAEGFFKAEAPEKFDEEEKNASKKSVSVTSASDNKDVRIRSFRFMTVFSIAASFLVLCMFYGGWWANTNYSNQAIALRHIDQQTVQSMVRGSNKNQTNVLFQGLEALENQDYPASIRHFEAIPTEEELYHQARLYLALAQFKSDAYLEAVVNAQIAAMPRTRFQEKARWLQINALLAAGQTDNDFQALLNDMIANSDDNYYQTKAQQLKQDLESGWRSLVF